jgi:hypothetical protein
MLAGADPTAMLQRFGERKGWVLGQRLHIISLGQGQGIVAETMIKQATASGDWICLQNCHLAASWMLRMEEKVGHAHQYPSCACSCHTQCAAAFTSWGALTDTAWAP